ncbi:hypothetical protein ACFC6L_10600 [Kitasatospora phosalacinea]|uniref:hypothetical protein n=1 Tax=Kitasatospora phosalacinea TaxID=2065 RepID=UPI0035E14FFF
MPSRPVPCRSPDRRPAPSRTGPPGCCARLLRPLTAITLVNTVGNGLGMTLGAVCCFTRATNFDVLPA